MRPEFDDILKTTSTAKLARIAFDKEYLIKLFPVKDGLKFDIATVQIDNYEFRKIYLFLINTFTV